LQAKVESVTNQSNESKSWFGKLVWGCTYENPQRSLVSLTITLSQPGTLWGTNHTRFPKMIEEQIAKTRISREVKEFERNAEQIITLPDGRKVYFTTLGFGPGGETLAGFSYERDYDLIVTEDFSTENGFAEKQATPPAHLTNDLPAVFQQVRSFLQNQQSPRGKP
jgi:hypothetical protein